MLKIEDLTKYYGRICGVKNLNLHINKGEIFGFVGPNGAGKSTTIRAIMGFIHKDKGSIFINGRLINEKDSSYKEDIGYLPGEINLYNNFTIEETLNFSASFYQKDCSKKMKELIKLFKLNPKTKIEELSFGNKKKVGIIIALMHEPKLLILDEPTNGLDPLMQNTLFELLREEKKKGTTIFFSTHILGEIKKICDRVGVIKNGTLLTIDEVNSINYKTEFNIVTIISEEYKKLSLPIKDIVLKEKSKDMIKFIYKGNINDLIKIVGKINIKNILIEEPDIDEIFIHYYK